MTDHDKDDGPRSSKEEREELKEARFEMQFGKVLDDVPEPKVEAFEPALVRVFEPSEAELDELEARDAALDRVTAALVKIGVSEDDLELIFGVEKAETRKAKLPKREKINNGKRKVIAK